MEREASSLSLSGRYLVLESIGAGGMGVVVKAHDCVLKIDVAIKCSALMRQVKEL